MTEPTDITISIRTVCRVCHLPLESTALDGGRQGWLIDVEPCPDCLGQAEAAGYERCERENDL